MKQSNQIEFSSKLLLWIFRNLNVDYTPKLCDWHFQSAIKINDIEISFMNSVLWTRLYLSTGKFFRGNKKISWKSSRKLFSSLYKYITFAIDSTSHKHA